jgi:hypothetical protein
MGRLDGFPGELAPEAAFRRPRPDLLRADAILLAQPELGASAGVHRDAAAVSIVRARAALRCAEKLADPALDARVRAAILLLEKAAPPSALCRQGAVRSAA